MRMRSWITEKGPQNEIVLSSRVRLARNLKNTPFPLGMDFKEAADIIQSVGRVIGDSQDGYQLYNMRETSGVNKQSLIERHLISIDLSKSDKGAVFIGDGETVSIMVNEEDHIRIQTILPGFQVDKAWQISDKIDDAIEGVLDYAYDEKLGYLTCCPTNVGTGMRVSTMVHLPALNLVGNIEGILQTLTRIGLTLRGLYGEGTEFLGNLFQISNQVTLGRSEEEIVENVGGVTSQIIQKEKEARSILLNNNRIKIEDRIWRSWGVLKNAKLMSSQECMKLLSDIRLGVDLEIIKNIDVSVLNEIMIETQPASIQKYSDRELSIEDRDALRAEIIRTKL